MNIIQKGTIDSGDYLGWKILIDDDRDGDTGGYYIYLQNENGKGFDFWCENEIDLKNQLTTFTTKWSTENQLPQHQLHK